MASLQYHAAVVLTLGLLAGCGGDRSRAGAGGDTTGTAVVTPDSAAMPVTDTAVPSRDSARSAAPSTPADTGTKSAAVEPAPKSAAAKPAAKPPVKAPTAARPASPPAGKQMATADTGTARDTGAAPAAAPVSAPVAQQDTQQQDSSKGASQPAEAPLRDAYHQAPRDTVTQAVYNGWKQFNLNCARCHGEDVLGTTIAPHLILSLKPDGPINSKELFVQTVCAGRPAKGMPAWCALGLEMDKINEIYEYVKGRSDAKIGPGRPAVKQAG
jgi:hypothetical protein